MATLEATTDYKKFKFLIDNRQTARKHINKLKEAILANPEILEVQPILVNEKYEIIDGQHRFQAASELGLPIHYSKVRGLDIGTAREMNVLQRKWSVEDYAMSYAKAGNKHYEKFNHYRREYPGIPVTILMIVLGAGSDSERVSLAFKTGKFMVVRTDEDAEWILDQLMFVKQTTGGGVPISKAFVGALLQCLENVDFDYEEFKKNLARKPELFHRTVVVRDALGMIEDIYNYQKHVNIIRLY